MALYLASAGVGTITIVDPDRVELTNLQRQIAHDVTRIGWHKVDSAAHAMAALNPQVRVHRRVERADAARLSELVRDADVVIDCTDNFVTRHAINAACVRHARPLVAGAAIGFDGQISVYDTREPALPCYACVFPAQDGFEEAQCATMGVFAPLVGVIGSMQAAEALKMLVQLGASLAGRLQMLDARSMEWTELKLRRDPRCTVCGHRPAAPG